MPMSAGSRRRSLHDHACHASRRTQKSIVVFLNALLRCSLMFRKRGQEERRRLEGFRSRWEYCPIAYGKCVRQTSTSFNGSSVSSGWAVTCRRRLGESWCVACGIEGGNVVCQTSTPCRYTSTTAAECLRMIIDTFSLIRISLPILITVLPFLTPSDVLSPTRCQQCRA